MIRTQTRHRNRKSHRPPAGIYHAPATEEEQRDLDRAIVGRTIDLLCSGVPVNWRGIHSGGARAWLETVLEDPLAFSSILSCRKLSGKLICVDYIRAAFPAAYDKWCMTYLTDEDKASMGIEVCDEAAMRQRSREREQERFAELRAFARAGDALCA